MTAQAADIIIVEGKRQQLFTNPLDQWFEKGGQRPRFRAPGSSCWRGYIATWEIAADRLYLLQIQGYGRDEEPITVSTVFPERPPPIEADWYTGLLRMPEGKLVKYVHGGYESQYERNVFIRITDGKVASRTVHDSRRRSTRERVSREHRSEVPEPSEDAKSSSENDAESQSTSDQTDDEKGRNEVFAKYMAMFDVAEAKLKAMEAEDARKKGTEGVN